MSPATIWLIISGLFDYYVIVLYDSDGTSVGNIRSPLRKTFMRMKSAGLDPRKLFINIVITFLIKLKAIT